MPRWAAARLRGHEVLAAVFPELKRAEKARIQQGGPADAAAKPISIRGLTEGISYNLAPCCHPLPGDRIVGLMAPGEGVSIHTIDCAELDKAQNMDDWLDVSWGRNAADSGPSVARVAVRVKNLPGSLAAVMTVIAANGGNIFNMKVTGRNPLYFEFVMDIEVRDVAHLQNIVGALRVNNAVESVDRVREAEVRNQKALVNVEQVLNEFKKSGALLEGHFILSSGLHSDKFLQKALVFQNAKRTAKLCKALAAKVKKEVKDEITAIVSPAVGGIVPGYEMGRQLGRAGHVGRAGGRRLPAAPQFHPEKGAKGADGGRHHLHRRLLARMHRRHQSDRRQGGGGLLPDRPLGRQSQSRRAPDRAWRNGKCHAWPADKLPPHLRNIPAVKPGIAGACVTGRPA